ncbi:NAD-dependent succinate-semialdehyde dehydrogenase [Marinobacter daepoensis]|uniref:NAD-dependent succinate-semialdehyde dehydrogenase n=1 Tax=Marinobacter daepoensis TaxID=262077 RepID=A0ABS3BAU0_9GAMM|nr:NAD-dependent succinate-semialdehyde dehydrogenase [Marinobacter daepoensis]MBN7768643.1 NAD-dependent succinate-semialdehyde dehydrogenase [Marinobacter daepoensis]MBY6032898.1 NAD-dependent succinate-semialdehyde dehydrogenase [Marinobacter daepoensis]MBY6079380.1 NAD-dependent succinate-semialdehyde dehydrogenase [Marinobacter daepoensis]
MFINGEWITGRPQFQVTNPATGEVIGEVPDCSDQDIEAAISAAHNSFREWRATTAYHRSQLLYRAWELMIRRKRELAELMTREQGKPLKASLNEVQYGADFLLWFAEEGKRMYGQSIPSSRENQRFLVQKSPVGVVGAITPWNYPISMITRKLAPALAAGCTVVLKPAESTPLCAQAMLEIFEEAGFPPGVINALTVQNPARVGQVFCTDPRVRKLTFTGSTPVGRELNGLAAANMKRVSMELGGHAPAIVFPDADPVHAAKGLSLVKYLNTGQACISPNRIFVHEDHLEPFIAELTSRTRRLVAGNGMNEGTGIGPLINELALQKVDSQVKNAVARGARIETGGQRLTDGELGAGFFYAPTVLSGVTPAMDIYREETFGPVAPVITYRSEDDVIAMANDTDYGLAAYIYSNNLSTAMRAFEALDFGIIGINDINPTSAAAPFGGMKNSGLGREGAQEGIDEYLETKLGGFAI